MHAIESLRILSADHRADLIQGQSESERSAEASCALRSSALSHVGGQVPHPRRVTKLMPARDARQLSRTSFAPSHFLVMHFIMARPRGSFS